MAASASAARTLSRYTGQLSNRATTDHRSLIPGSQLRRSRTRMRRGPRPGQYDGWHCWNTPPPASETVQDFLILNGK